MSSIKTYAIYKNGTLVLEDPVNLPDHARVEVVIRKKFSEFVKKFGEPEAKEEVDKLLQTNRKEDRMPDFSSCVLDTSVVIKALFSPSHQHAGTTYAREVKTHKVCISLLSVLDVQGIEVFIPHAVSSRLPLYHPDSQISMLRKRSAVK